MRFLERCDRLIRLRDRAWSLFLVLCREQSGFGDFHLKTTLAIAAADALGLCDALDRKRKALRVGLPEGRASATTLPGKRGGQNSKRLSKLSLETQAIQREVQDLLSRLGPYVDLNLEDTLQSFLVRWNHDVQAIAEWELLGPTEAPALEADGGLYRDCQLLEPKNKLTFRLNEDDFRDASLRAGYIGANAYLELASVDIVSDLILQAWEAQSAHSRGLISDLGRQLLDEARHAELLADRAQALGMNLGHVGVSLHTWHLVRSFPSLAEKLVAQQVIQEGVGLDASALNILRLARVGDRESSEVYAQITADEANHVSLGIRWATRMGRLPLDSLVESVGRKVQEIDPPPDIPVAVESAASR